MLQEDSTISNLRQVYQEHLQKRPPQRVKGIAYEYIIMGGFTILFFFPIILIILSVVSQVDMISWLYQNSCLGILFSAILWYVTITLPSYFYDDTKSTKRWAKRHYPKVYAQIYQFKQKDKEDRMIAAPFLLHVEGHKLFIGPYGKQGLLDTKATLTGSILMDENANLLTDKDLFHKAFLTYSYGNIGSVDFARQFFGRSRAFLDEWKIYVPRSQRFLIRQKNYLEGSGYGHEWEEIIELLPVLLEAGKVALSLYEGRARFRKSIGYSFAHEFWYEDALEEQAMRQAFVKYMQHAYRNTIIQIRAPIVHILGRIEQNGTSWRKKIIIKTLKKIWSFAFEIQVLIERMEQNGIPSEENMEQFESKTSYAKIIQQNKSE